MTANPPELFASAAEHYVRFRPWYPDELFALLTERFDLDGTQTALDLGCGPGMSALPLAPHVARLYAIDPEPGMLAAGARLAEKRGVTNIQWINSDSTQITALDLPPIDLCVMAKSFHWFDRPRLLADLDHLITPGGGVVIASAGPPGTTPLPAWAAVIAQVRTAYLGPVRRAGTGTYPEPEDRFTDTLRRSPFSRVELTSLDQHVTRDLDQLVGLQLSNSYSTPALLGDRLDAFTRDLRRALLDHDPSGLYHEEIRTEVLIATRPDRRSTTP
ncbi:class I SAM-dependent methyltransferase (plasmid) [Streptomyces sp. NBC_01255]|uniref:class I SAM-dependent methyltransferase n=1 Tax=Streptomyces sp. NBC_01255 TaxID=2903798 RepID=UPI002E2EE73C|nr:class I SAM-dependent methyltransferase [Streptomyces sp. NBC_01255]